MNKKYFLIILSMFFLLVLTMVISLFTGSVKIKFIDIYKAVFNNNPMYKTIIFDLRLPRIILAIAVGGGLSISGIMLQGIFRNPLVEPYTLGISGGAAIGIAINILFKISKFGIYSFPLSGFIGASLIIIILYAITLKNRSLNLNTLLLTGVMLSFISSSLLMLLMALSKTEDLQNIVLWMMGSLAQFNFKLVILMLIISLTGLFAALFYSNQLNAMQTGEESAKNLGINTNKLKNIVFIITSVITGISVSITGIIGFIGLIIPHLNRKIFSTDYRYTIITSYITGAIFLIISDMIARTIISPIELPVGVITGIIGGGIFIYLFNYGKK